MQAIYHFLLQDYSDAFYIFLFVFVFLRQYFSVWLWVLWKSLCEQAGPKLRDITSLAFQLLWSKVCATTPPGWEDILKNIFKFHLMCFSCMYVCVKVLGFLKQELKAVVNCTWVLGIEPRPSGQAASALTHWAFFSRANTMVF